MMSRSESLFERAKQVLPGGVNSPVRAYQSVGGCPRFIKKAEGTYVYDEEGKRYLDYIGSWGPMILGHNHPEIQEAVIGAARNGLSFGTATEMEVQMGELLCELVPCFDMVRMVNSGTEAVMSAIRAARGFTGRDKIIKFEGCYHGHFDALLVKAGSGVMTAGIPDSSGVPKGCAKDTLTAVYNDMDSVRTLFEDNQGQIAALIIEPVAANMGVVLPEEGFLKELRKICTQNGTLLIFDEVITGFRLGLQGAQGAYGVTPDLATFGKIIGGGMPVGCYGGRREIMEMIAPLGSVYQAGTLSGNPVAMAAGLKELSILKEHPEIYGHLEELGETFRSGVRDILKKHGAKCQITGTGSLSCLFFTDIPVTNYEEAKTSDVRAFADYFHYMLDHGIHLAPSQFEAIFFNNAMKPKDVDQTLRVMDSYFALKE